jgi:ATP-binding cassette subfamily B protein
LIDGQDIYTVTQNSLHDAIGMIPQDPSLFNRSLRENIRYGRINATDNEIIEAAKKAHAHEFIAELPQGYDLMVGERGSKLSGGQRQRIAIARAMLKDAPILIMDEATSGLDKDTEDKLFNNLIKRGITIIIISHNLTLKKFSNKIITIDNGSLI